jgi:copper chaperone CopZ
VSTLQYVVPGVSCGHCKSAIEGEVSQVPGVERVEVDVDTKRVVVEGTASAEAVVAAIGEAGYDEVEPA